MLLPPKLSDRTEKVLRLHALSGGSTMREERVQESAFDSSSSVRRITEFYDTGSGKSTQGGRLGSVLALPPVVQTCVAALIDHLRAFKLERVLRLTGNLQVFSESGACLVVQTMGTQRGATLCPVGAGGPSPRPNVCIEPRGLNGMCRFSTPARHESTTECLHTSQPGDFAQRYRRPL